MYITVGRKHIVIGKQGRIAAASCLALLLHAFVLWGLLLMRPKPYVFHDDDNTPPINVEMYQLREPPPEPVPDIKFTPHEVQPKPQPQVEPPKVEPRPQQQAAAAPAPTPTPPTPQPPTPTPAPEVAIKVQPVPQLSLDKLQAKQITQANVASVNDAAAPSVESKTKTKQRKDEEAGLQKPVANVASLSSLNIHQAPASAPTLEADVEPSGLPAPAGSPPGGKPGGGPNGGGAQAGLNGAQGIIGKGMKGRGSLTQAMQNHDYCNTAVVKGKDPPPNCNMTGLSGKANLGLIDRPDLKKAAAERDANLQYKTGAGNSDYWNRVSGSPSTGIQPNFRPDDQPHKGAYSNPKDQRVMDGVNTDPKSGN